MGSKFPEWISPDGKVRLYLGDCMDVLPTLGKVDAVVTDPPYGVDLVARVTKHTKRTASKKYQDDFTFVVEEIIPRLSAWLAIVPRAAVTPGIRMLQSYPHAADLGGVFQPNGAGCGPWGFTCFHPILFYGKCPYLAQGKGSQPTAIRSTHWKSDDVDHPCPKPVEFMQWMVERATRVTDIVADPFAGSFTTAVACIRTNRRFIGIEKERKYWEIGVERVKKEYGRKGVIKSLGSLKGGFGVFGKSKRKDYDGKKVS
jgi:site-specific DNA-methyltransferase (adenine-specific)